MFTDDPLQRLQARLGYRFSRVELLQQALTHRSAAADNNERLEFLGDAVLGAEIAARLYHRFSNADEGELSRLRAQLVKRDTLAAIAREQALGDHLALGPGELKSGGRSRASILADAVEAIIAAVYLDSGRTAAAALIERLWGPRLGELDTLNARKDPKTRLQEYLQARQLALPSYEVMSVQGAEHAQCFTVRCVLQAPPRHTQADGASRRRAEQAAAARMLEQLTAD